MFSIKYIDKSPQTPNGQIYAQIFEEADWLYSKDDFPFVFEVYNSNKLKWSCNIKPYTFATWDCLEFNNLEAFIKDKMGNILAHFKLDPSIHRNSTIQFFNQWSLKNKNASGVVIGTHDGMAGEWVEHVKNSNGKSVLVEGSSHQFKELTKNYKEFQNIVFRNEVVTSDGRDVQFFEFGTGEANTVSREHYEKHINDTDKIAVRNTKSIGINELILSEGLQDTLEWLHLDTESIDDEIIMGLDFSKVKKPSLIVFETINFSFERTGNYDRIDRLFGWLKSNGYNVKYDYWNSYAYLIK